MPRMTNVRRAVLEFVLIACLQLPNISWADDVQNATPPIAYGFAKASPLNVYELTDQKLSGTRKFEFGRAYPILRRDGQYIEVEVSDGDKKYVRAAHMMTIGRPNWLATTKVYEEKERSVISFWESSAKIADFLTGRDTSRSSWDYRELLFGQESDSRKFPVFATDTVDLLDGARSVDIAGVLVPISKGMSEAFNRDLNAVGGTINLHFVLDVSGSAEGFVEPAFQKVVGKITEDRDLLERIVNFDVLVFGMTGVDNWRVAGEPIGDISNERQIGYKRASGPSFMKKAADNFVGKPSLAAVGDDEPILNALEALVEKNAAGTDEKLLHIIIVMSGADVAVNARSALTGKLLNATDLDFSRLGTVFVVFCQITPEPGLSLRDVSAKLNGIEATYIDFDDAGIGWRVVEQLRSYLSRKLSEPRSPNDFERYFGAAKSSGMMPILPANLNGSSALPIPLKFAVDAEWYAIPLWTVIDGTLLELKE